MSVRLHRASNRSPVRLGPMLGKGGEGAVHSVRESPNLVAKIYRNPPDALKVHKLFTMARMASPDLLRVAAWPVDLLLDDSRVMRGFLMHKVSAREDVHELYSPKSRRQAFPNADFRFIVRVGANIARAFARMHAQGHVLGDVNHGNALIGHDGTVVLIDCDSFQIRDRIRTYNCDVGVPLFTAPELQGRRFRGLRRSANHDAFGLAVLLFHLLFGGRHPFAGRHASGEMPIERAIAESRFAYGSASVTLGVSAPPGTLPLHAFGPRIAGLFERAFAPPGSADRPAATEWIEALHELEQELAPCSVSRLHFHRRESVCCWCEVESRTGVRLFGAQPPGTEPSGAAALEVLWNAIAAVPPPSPVPGFPTQAKRTPEPRYEDGLGKFPRILVSWLLVLFGVVCLLMDPGEHLFLAFTVFLSAVVLRSPTSQTLIRRAIKAERQLELAESRWQSVTARWNRECTSKRFDDVLEQLEDARRKLADLPKRREAQIANLERAKAREQRKRFLHGFRIAEAAFQNITPKEIAALARLGIETAADVARGIPRPQPVLSEAAATELLAWCQARDREFRLDPNEPPDPSDLARIDERFQSRRELLVAHLSEGPALLRRKREEISLARASLQKLVDEAWKARTQAHGESGELPPN
jgi:DNA-binding helix-hairpin-helix protein with protein kinase domain